MVKKKQIKGENNWKDRGKQDVTTKMKNKAQQTASN